MTNATPQPTIWPTLLYKDAPAAIDFLRDVFGFEVRLVVTDEQDPSIIHHSQLNWPEGGVVSINSADADGDVFRARPTGCAGVYVITDRVDELAKAADAAGVTFVRELRDEESYDGRGFSIADAEGNLWSFGTYRGE